MQNPSDSKKPPLQPILIGGDPDREITDREAIQILRHVRHLALLLDSAFSIPGTNVTFGWDSLIGLIPGIGDAATAALSGYIILLSRRCGLSKWQTSRMVANTLVDLGIGIVPVVGDMYDVGWKANRKNVAILERHLHRRFPHLKDLHVG